MKSLSLAALCLLAIALPGCAQSESSGRKSDAAGTQAAPRTAGSAPSSSAATGAADSLLVIDVRTPGEFAQGHVAGALNIPYDEIAGRIAAVAPDKNRHIVLYCRSGRRSGIALQTLQSLGYQHVENAGAYEDLIRR